MHPVCRPTILAVTSLVFATVTAQQLAPPELPGIRPHSILSSSATATTIQFGRARLTLPGRWRFEPSGLLCKGTGPDGSLVFINVPNSGNSAVLDERGILRLVENGKQRIDTQIGDTCTNRPKVELQQVSAGAGQTILVGMCDELSKLGAPTYYLHYEVYSTNGVIQIFSGGNGSSSAGRAIFDPTAQSLTWAGNL